MGRPLRSGAWVPRNVVRRADFVRRYDRAIFDKETRELYEGSDFFNVGDWSPYPAGPPGGLGEAARRLVERHLAVDPPEAAAAARVVLDVGCGLGPTTRMIARYYPAVLVLGINLSVLQAAHAAAITQSAAHFVAMDATHLAIASNAVDRIHSVEAAFHFDTRLDFLHEARRVLRPGGKLVLTDILFRREAHRVLRPGGKLVLTDILFRRALPDIPEENLWASEADYRDKCASTGLTVECFQDLTDCTVRPYCDYLAAKGKRVLARALRRSVVTYCLVVLQC